LYKIYKFISTKSPSYKINFETLIFSRLNYVQNNFIKLFLGSGSQPGDGERLDGVLGGVRPPDLISPPPLPANDLRQKTAGVKFKNCLSFVTDEGENELVLAVGGNQPI
jgi:hypothetical protein